MLYLSSYFNDLIDLLNSINFSLDFVLQSAIFATGLAGQYLIAKRDYKGFYLWIVGNIAIIAVSIPREMYGMATLYAINSVFSVYSIKEWSKDLIKERRENG